MAMTGADDLAHAGDRGLHRRLAALEMPMDVFHHHDRVVDDEADGEHHGEQRQEIDGIAHQVEHEADADRARAGW